MPSVFTIMRSSGDSTPFDFAFMDTEGADKRNDGANDGKSDAIKSQR